MPVALAKTDIKGAEGSPAKCSDVSIEIPVLLCGQGKLRQFLARMSGMGCKRVEKEPVASVSRFLCRG